MSGISHLATESATARHQRFVAETFHVLGQPLTALRCSLELALHVEHSGEAEYRAALQNALFHTERVLEAATYARELAEAEDPGRTRLMDCGAFLREVVQDFDPVAESANLKISLHCDTDLVVDGDPDRLRSAMFRLLDALLHGAKADADIAVDGIRRGQSVEIRLTATLNGLPAVLQRRAFKIAERTFRAVGGVAESRSSGDKFEVIFVLPAISPRPDVLSANGSYSLGF